jgi:hypothetical protein
MGLFLVEHPKDLPLGCAMDTDIGDGAFPLAEEVILSLQGLEGAIGQRVAFDVADAVLHLPLVLRGFGKAGQDRQLVVAGEVHEPGIEIGIGPIEVQDGGLEVVEVMCPGT